MKKNEIDYSKGFELALKNAQDHLKVAEFSAKNVSNGIAFSHLVLASEEAIKAVQLFYHNYFPEFPDEDLEKFFKSHKHKHTAIQKFEVLSQIIELMFKHLIDPQLEYINSSDEIDPETISKLRVDGIKKLAKKLTMIAEDEEKLSLNEQWWKQADNNKNKGFYVNLLSKSSTWSTPDNISPKLYTKGYNIVSSFINQVIHLNQFSQHPLFNDVIILQKEIIKKYPRKKKNIN